MIFLTAGHQRDFANEHGHFQSSKSRSDTVVSMLSMSVAASVTGKWHAQNAWDDSGN